MARSSIAKMLNAEGASCPRSQQGRPRGWAPPSIREVLYRDAYHGLIVWNKTRKRDAWGQLKPSDRNKLKRPESDWLRVSLPALRIVSDDLWTAAHARLQETQQTYLRATGGRLWGHPLNGMAAKYLLTGLSRCGQCGGSMEVRSRSHGKRRMLFYGGSVYHRRGRAVCSNGLEVPLDATEQAVIEDVERKLLTPAFVESVVRKVLTRAIPTGPALDEAAPRSRASW